MKIAYITAQTPWGPGEAFILPEVLELKRQGHHVVVFPLRPGKLLAKGSEAEEVARQAVSIPLLGLGVFFRAVGISLCRLFLVLRLLGVILCCSGGPRKALKNLVVLPKSLVLGEKIKRGGFEHIHAHWASTPSTAAYIACRVSDIPFSFTAHRWDISEANLLAEKVRTALFVRAIDESGAEEIRARVPPAYARKIHVIHVGVRLPLYVSLNRGTQTDHPINIIAVGYLVPKKGHSVLIDSCALLRERGTRFRCRIFGDGPLGAGLKRQVEKRSLVGLVELCGAISHDEVLALYGRGDVDIYVHPSIETPSGEREGIPVALMEAMAAGVPVISTTTGGIPELVVDGTGILVPPGDPLALADAIERLTRDPAFRRRLGAAGRKRIEDAFSLEAVCRQLVVKLAGQ